ncbi:hypothetical protein MBANPS3_000658 [Mucor bainieri]
MDDSVISTPQPTNRNEPASSRANSALFRSATSTSRTVRVNWLRFLFYSWKRISILSKLVVSCSVALVIAQVAVGIAMLVTARGESCDQPLQTFIIVYMVRTVISCPFYIGQHFERAQERLRIQRQRERDSRREEQVRHRRQQRREERRRLRAQQQQQQQVTPTTTQEQLIPSNASIHSTIMEPRSNQFFTVAERLRSLVDLFAVLWFIVGNYLLFSSKTCSALAPRLYYTSLAYVLIGYLVVIVPILLCTSAIFCLPCVMLGMRVLNIPEMDGMEQGARQEEISKVPVYRFRTSDNSQQTQQQQQQGVTTQPPEQKSKGVLGNLMRGGYRHQMDAEQGPVDDIFITPSEDAMCCICLAEYEDQDLLCRLWCGHHFHKSCLTEWLALNKKCPLCKQDFRGKEYEEDSQDEDDVDDDDYDSLVENAIPMQQLPTATATTTHTHDNRS